MPTPLKASLTIQIYDCPRPTFDATLTACDRPLYDYLASQPTPERAWQKAERMRIVGDVERARDQAVAACEASRFPPLPPPAPEGVQLFIVTKGVTPAPKPKSKGLTAVVRIDIAPQPACPQIPFLVLVAGAGFRPRMLWQGGRMAFIAPATANSLSRQITLAFDALLDHAVWYDNDTAAPWELRQRHAPFDLTKQRVTTQGDAARDHFHVAIIYEEIGGPGRTQYDRTLAPNQDRWTLADARTGAIGLSETIFDIPIPDNLSGSWRQRVILWRFDRGPTPVSATYDNHLVVAGNSHIWAFDDDEWRETRQKVMEVVREIRAIPPLPFTGAHFGVFGTVTGEKQLPVSFSVTVLSATGEGLPSGWYWTFGTPNLRLGPYVMEETRRLDLSIDGRVVASKTGHGKRTSYIQYDGEGRYPHQDHTWEFTDFPHGAPDNMADAITNGPAHSMFAYRTPDRAWMIATESEVANVTRIPWSEAFAAEVEASWAPMTPVSTGTDLSINQAADRYRIPALGAYTVTAKASDAWVMPDGRIAFTKWEKGGSTDELEAYLVSRVLGSYRGTSSYRNTVFDVTTRPVLIISKATFDRLVALSDPLEIRLDVDLA